MCAIFIVKIEHEFQREDADDYLRRGTDVCVIRLSMFFHCDITTIQSYNS